jgi:MFS family permease
MFFTMQIQLAFLLTNYYAVRTPAEIGMLTAIGSLSVPLGAFAFRATAKLPIQMQLFVAFFLLGVTFTMMNHAPSTTMLMVFVVVNQFACGLLLPTMVIWVMGGLPFDVRGRGTGIFMACWWIGQFLSPQVIALLNRQTSALPATLQVLGLLCLVAGPLAALYRAPKLKKSQA